jgi:uncharacterized protein YkwD
VRKGLATLVAILVLAGQAEASPQQDILGWMNQARSGPNLVVGGRIDELAQTHSERMAAKERIFHTADLVAKLIEAGVSFWICGENVGSSTVGLRAMFLAFMRSPPHRANILNPAFRRVGIGIARARGALWVTLIFVG